MRILLILFVALACIQCKSPDDQGTKDPKPVVNQAASKDPFSDRIQKNPENASLYLQRAIWYIERFQYSPALGDLDKHEKLDSTSAEMYFRRGECNYYLNKSRQARTDWEKAVSLDPDRVDVRMKLAQLYMYVEMTKKSFEHLEVALSLNPNNAEAYFIAGMNYKSLKDTNKSIEAFQKSVDITPTAAAYENIGVMYAARGNSIALDYYQSALDLRPSSLSTLYNIAVYYQEREEWNAAIEGYTKVLQIKPDHPASLYAMGYVHTELALWNEAIDFFGRALNVDARNVAAWHGRGYAFERRGDVGNAENCYREALKILDDYPPAIAGLKRLKEGVEVTKP